MRCPCCGSTGPCYCFRNRPPVRPRNAGRQPARQVPVYRRPRNHAYSCRCGRCPQSQPGDWGIIGPGLLIIGVIAVIGFWPAMVWHGYGGPAGTAWRWDIHSTIGCLIWWGFLAAVIALAWADRRPQRTVRPPRGRLNVEALPPPAVVAPPICLHLNAVMVESITDPAVAVAYWCEACETQLGEDFTRPMRPCCGTPPGGDHLYNCQYADRLPQ